MLSLPEIEETAEYCSVKGTIYKYSGGVWKRNSQPLTDAAFIAKNARALSWEMLQDGKISLGQFLKNDFFSKRGYIYYTIQEPETNKRRLVHSSLLKRVS